MEVQPGPHTAGLGGFLSDIFTSLGRRRRWWRWRRPRGRRRGLGDKRKAAAKRPEKGEGRDPQRQGPGTVEGPGAAIWEPASDPCPQGLRQTDRHRRQGRGIRARDTRQTDRGSRAGTREGQEHKERDKEKREGRAGERRGKEKKEGKRRKKRERGEQRCWATAPGVFEAAGCVPSARGQARSPASSRGRPTA